MRIAYSERLKRNYLILEDGEHPTVDHVLTTAHMHRCERVCCGGKVKIAIARAKPDGSVSNPSFVSKAALGRLV